MTFCVPLSELYTSPRSYTSCFQTLGACPQDPFRDDGLVQGFSMRDDRGMTSPLNEDLSAWADRAIAAMPDDKTTGSLDIPPEALEHLKALGYMQ